MGHSTAAGYSLVEVRRRVVPGNNMSGGNTSAERSTSADYSNRLSGDYSSLLTERSTSAACTDTNNST